MSNTVIPVDVIRHTLSNGLGRYVCQLQRLTLKFCKEYKGSSGVRTYIEQHLVEFAKQNPGVVVYLLPQRHTKAQLVAEYLNGRKEEFCIDKMGADEITKWIELYRTRSGQPIQRIRKPWLTSHPSIQGLWDPQMSSSPALNTSKFPVSQLSEAYKLEDSATDVVKRMASLQSVQK